MAIMGRRTKGCGGAGEQNTDAQQKRERREALDGGGHRRGARCTARREERGSGVMGGGGRETRERGGGSKRRIQEASTAASAAAASGGGGGRSAEGGKKEARGQTHGALLWRQGALAVQSHCAARPHVVAYMCCARLVCTLALVLFGGSVTTGTAAKECQSKRAHHVDGKKAFLWQCFCEMLRGGEGCVRIKARCETRSSVAGAARRGGVRGIEVG